MAEGSDVKEIKELYNELSELSKFVLKHEGKDAVCSLNFVVKDEIQELNKKYRDIDAPTDVLSFESDIEGDLGDIFICVDVAVQNSKNYFTSVENELKLLTVHGCLHLCGYDHMTDEEAEVMEAKEEEILDEWLSK